MLGRGLGAPSGEMAIVQIGKLVFSEQILSVAQFGKNDRDIFKTDHSVRMLRLLDC